MRAVANRLADADAEAEHNFEAHAAELKANTPETRISARETRAQRRASKEPGPISPPSATPDAVRKQDRVAAWVDSSQLDDVLEEDSEQEEAVASVLDHAESEPSSFPDGSFNHSYNYERGIRGPNLPLPEPDPTPKFRQKHAEGVDRSAPVPGGTAETTTSLRTPSWASRVIARSREGLRSILKFARTVILAVWSWLSRMVQMMQKSISEVPDAPITSALFKTLLLTTVIGIAGISFCTLFTYTCNPGSSSIISQSLQRICGQCTGSNIPEVNIWNLTNADPNDLSSLLTALRQTQSHISQIESRLNNRIDSSHASHVAGTAALRSHQEVLETQIRRLRSQSSPNQQISSQSVSSPLIADKINFFSISSGATILPDLTSPTRIQGSSIFKSTWKIAKRMVGQHQPGILPAVTALEPWIDEGDCWCAAANHSLRLGIQLTQQIYPTELVIEHFPSTSSLNPGNAPQDIELWADFRGLSAKEWTHLHVEDLIVQSGMPPVGTFKGDRPQTWARIGTATYAISSSQHSGPTARAYEMAADDTFGMHQAYDLEEDGMKTDLLHVQRFNLQVNQHGLLHYANRYLLRVSSNHGADHTCLYRVRLHGLPIDRKQTANT